MTSSVQIIESAPYNSAYDPSDNFIQVLHKPGVPLQSRELIEAQTIARTQLASFAGHVFANGSRVIGGGVTTKRVDWVKLLPTQSGVPVVASEWVGRTIYALDGSLAALPSKARVIHAFDAIGADPPTLYLEYVSTKTIDPIPSGAQIRAEGSGLQATAASVDHYGQAAFVGISEGTYFIDGSFIKITSTSLICGKYAADVTGSVGFEYDFKVVTSETDERLLDTAPGPRNAGYPGADRLSIDVTPKFIDTTVAAVPSNFVSVLTFEEGIVKTQEKVPIYSDVAVELARRTEDESGSYTVRPFKATTSNSNGVKLIEITHSGPILAHIANAKSSIPHRLQVGKRIVISGCTGVDATIYNGEHVVQSVTTDYDFTYSLSSVPTNDAIGDPIQVTDADEFTIRLGAGKAYVRGYEIETISDTSIDADRARTTGIVQNFQMTPYYGSYFLGSLSVGGAFSLLDETATVTMELRDNANAAIGTCRLRHFRLHSGSPTSTAGVWKAYVHNIKLNAGKTNADIYRIADATNGGILVLQRIATGPELFETKRSTSIFRAPRAVVKTLAPGGISDISHSYRKKFSGAVSGGGNSVTFSCGVGETFVGPVGSNFAGGSVANESYLFFDTINKAAIAPTSLIIAAGGQQITANFSSGGITVTMVGAVVKSSATQKTKTSTTQTLTITYAGDKSTSLAISDAYRIVSIRNVATLAYHTDQFNLDTGQRDFHYDHSAIVRKGSVVPGLTSGQQLTVVVERFTHSGTGFFSVDSYTNVLREDIPSYVASDGETYDLADCVDFRTVRADGGTAHVGILPPPDSVFVADVEFYLPRRDRVVLTKGGIFKVVQGSPSPSPQLPPEPNDSMTLYEMYVEAYTADPVADVSVKFVENKRYTMRDIGRIEKRVDRLEYYTALSFLESATANLDLTDDSGLDRFKNGILVDPLTGHKVGDVRSGDYKISIDPSRREMRPPFVSENVSLSYAPLSSSAAQVGNADVGSFLTIPYTERTFLDHPYATKFDSVNPYLVAKFIGKMECNPPSDDWMDTSVRPAVNADLTGDLDAWTYMVEAINANMAPGFGTQWGDWETTWTGVDTSITNSQSFDASATSVRVVDTRTTSTTTSSNQIRRGDQNVLGVGVAQTSLGEKVVDVNIVHGMREVVVGVAATGMRPNTNVHVFVDDVKLNANFVASVGFTPTTEGCARTDAFGRVVGTLTIPGGVFRTGERVICVIDEPNKVEANASTYAKFVFAASGISVAKQDTILSTRIPQVETRSIVDNRVVRDVVSTSVSTTTQIEIPPPQQRESNSNSGEGQGDPLAQTFIIPQERHQNGVFLSSVDLFFKRKSSTLPIWIEILPTVNGFPHASKTIPLSYVSKNPADVNLPTQTDDIVSIRAAATNFEFPVPIYLEPGVEYALKVQSNDSEYECYIAELGQKLLGSNQIVLQSSLGSLFKSQNSRAWTPFQAEDLMLKINICDFDVNTQPVVVFTGNPTTTVDADSFRHDVNALVFDGVARMSTSHKMMDRATSAIPSTWTDFQTGTTNVLDTRKRYDSTVGCLQIRSILSTISRDVAPLIDLTRNSVIAIANQVNNFGLISSDFEIFDEGASYTNDTTVSASGGGGSGAALSPIISGGKIVGIQVDQPGEGYESEVTITVTDTTGTGAQVFYRRFETGNYGGNALARYLTRRVKLADEFVTNFIKVTADIYKPAGTSVVAYVKCLAQEDPAAFDARPWQKLNQVSGFKISSRPDEFVETVWTPVGGSLSYVDGGNTYPASKTFAVKFVLLSNDTTKVPLLRDPRFVSGAP